MNNKIIKVEITNFRNIKFSSFELDRVSVISGKNNLGKSNSLNAINWLLTNKLLTDKYGDGENDSQSIIPTDLRKGEYTSVSIWLSTGAKFTKNLKRSYDRNGKPTKNTTEYEINNAKVGTQKEFYNNLYNLLEFKPTFTNAKIDEVCLFTDPFYALLKLDYKELRNVLVALGCNISDEELYSAGFEDLRPLGTQFMGKWSDARKFVKDEVNNVNKTINRTDDQLRLFNDVDTSYKPRIEELEKQVDELVAKRTTLLNTNSNDLVKDINSNIIELELKKQAMINESNANFDKKINESDMEYKNLLSNFEKKKFEATQNIINTLGSKREELSTLKEQLANKNLENANCSRLINESNNETFYLNATKNNLSVELGKIINQKNEIECPICGSKFEIDAEEHQKSINEIALKIEDIEKKILQFEEQKGKASKEQDSILVEIETLKNKINDLQNEINKLVLEKANIENTLTIDDEAKRLESKIEKLQKEKYMVDFPNITNQIEELKARANKILTDSQSVIDTELQEINQKISLLRVEIKEEYEKQTAILNKTNLESTRKQLIEQLNNTESRLARVNSLIHYMINAINEKAQMLTGFKFVMLEENLTNDSLTECCYVVDNNNVPFKDINTARKVEIGCKFIEAIRNKYPNNLPILADRLEGIDYIEKIKDFSENQIICTRVSTDTTLNIVNL